MNFFHLLPPEASANAASVDVLFEVLVAFTVIIAGSIGTLMLYFLVKYRAASDADRSAPVVDNHRLEWSWIIVATVVSLGMFAWGARDFFTEEAIPTHGIHVEVIGKQWMWKFFHPDGRREIDELHVPVGKPIILRMRSADVIHSFYVPAFRLKQDLLPDRYTQISFTATEPGTYDLFCAEYCGTKHAEMGGKIIVMKPEDFQHWLQSGTPPKTMAAKGRNVYMREGCAGCHEDKSGTRAPSLRGLFGTRVTLADGTSTIANEEYIRDSIELPLKQKVAGYKPIMPSFSGQISEEEMFELIAYIRSLASSDGGGQ